jgi:hypothetical protein
MNIGRRAALERARQLLNEVEQQATDQQAMSDDSLAAKFAEIRTELDNVQGRDPEGRFALIQYLVVRRDGWSGRWVPLGPTSTLHNTKGAARAWARDQYAGVIPWHDGGAFTNTEGTLRLGIVETVVPMDKPEGAV